MLLCFWDRSKEEKNGMRRFFYSSFEGFACLFTLEGKHLGTIPGSLNSFLNP
jgi:hypothetical protein